MRTHLDRLNIICSNLGTTVRTTYDYSGRTGLVEVYNDPSNLDYIISGSGDDLSVVSEKILKQMVNDGKINDRDVTIHYNLIEMVEYLKFKLNITHSYLGGLLGVSEKSLMSWCDPEGEDPSRKSLRLIRLFEVTYYLFLNLKDYQHDECLSLLHNSRFVFDPSDEEDGSCSLIGYILANPEGDDWRMVVDDAVSSYRKEREEELSSLALECKKPATEEENETVEKYYNLSIIILLDEDVTSVSLLQRKLKIGYNTACHIIDRLELDRIIGPSFDKFYHKVLIKRTIKNP